MNNIVLINENKEPFNAEVVRYFTLNNSKYLLFTKNERDENNYVKLYAVKIISEIGNIITKNIDDDTEWSNIKHQIQVIVNNNRNNVPNNNDLDYQELNNTVITQTRIFKLANESVKELGAYKQNAPLPIEPKKQVSLEDTPKQDTDYKALYEQQQQEILNLKNENQRYEIIIDQIKHLMNQ